MANFFTRLFSFVPLEDQLQRERAEIVRLKLEHSHEIERLVDRGDDLRESHRNAVAELKDRIDAIEALYQSKEKLLQGQIDTANNERQHMQDAFLRMCGVEPIYTPTPKGEIQPFEDQPDDSGLIGSRILSRAEKEAKRQQTEEEEFRKWEDEKLGMTSAKIAATEGDY